MSFSLTACWTPQGGDQDKTKQVFRFRGSAGESNQPICPALIDVGGICLVFGLWTLGP